MMLGLYKFSLLAFMWLVLCSLYPSVYVNPLEST
jgi:hypothetical protein